MHPRITVDPKVMFGKPVIRGTRITVEFVLRMLGSGWSAEDILREYDDLTTADIMAAQAFAADYMSNGAEAAAE